MDDKISKSAFGRALGLSPGRVTQLIVKGLPVSEDGRFVLLGPAKTWYQDHIRGSARKRGPKRLAIKSDRKRRGISSSDSSAAERLLAAQADRAESLAVIAQLEAGRRKGELVELAEIEQSLSRVIIGARNRFLYLADKVGPQVIRMTDVHEAVSLIEGEVRAALEDLSNYKPDESYGKPKRKNDRVGNQEEAGD